jgi:hypothetical protein
MIKTIQRMIIFAAFALGLPLRADQVVMQNGDTFNGTVLSVATNVLVLQNENLGIVTLPRVKVTAVVFGAGTTTTAAPRPAPSWGGLLIPGTAASPTNSAFDLTAVFRGIRSQTNLIQQVESQVLGSANPDAINKFNELLDGLSTGRIDMNGLRAQAQSAAEQLRSLKSGLGPDASGEAESYLAILDVFLQETAPVNVTTNRAATNAPAGP